MMKKILLNTVAISCVLMGAAAFAQDRAVPDTRQDIQLSFSPVVKKTSPAVVNIYTKRTVTQRVSPFMADPLFQRFFGNMAPQGLSREQIQSSLGSGVIVEADGLIVTNSHVIKGADEIVAVLNDGREFDAKVSLVDERSDLAILRIDGKGADLPFVPLKPSDNLEVGDIVIAIGNPFGVGQTVTSGIVSALARSSLNINDFNFFIQTDAAINPGNSGGPLVSMDGGIVGINTAIFSKDGGSLGIGFAVPSEMVATVIAAEKSGNHTGKAIPRSWMGIAGQKVTADIADSLGMNRPQGVLISKLHPQSPLLSAGLKTGDVITHIDDKAIRDGAELKFRMATIPLGQETQIKVLRKGEPKTFPVKTIAPPDKPAREETDLGGNHILSGVKVSNINPAVGVELKLESDIEGVVVAGIEQGRRVGRLLRPGDIIYSINDVKITSVKQLQNTIDKAMAQGVFALTIEREGKKTQIVVR
jgi:Do/DeqQ family serine protease